MELLLRCCSPVAIAMVRFRTREEIAWTEMLVQVCTDQPDWSSQMDEREFHSILTFSLKSLFGECHPHYDFEIAKNSSASTPPFERRNKGTPVSFFRIACPAESANPIRAALTCCEVPHYYTTSRDNPLLIRFDVCTVREQI